MALTPARPEWPGRRSRTGSGSSHVCAAPHATVEDRLTLIDKVPEDQHRLRDTDFDQVTELLVVEREVNKLRDLDAIEISARI